MLNKLGEIPESGIIHIYVLGYGFGRLVLLVYVALHSLHYRYKNKDRISLRDTFMVSDFNQEVFYDIGIDTIISSLTVSIVLTIIKIAGNLSNTFS